MDKNRDDKRKVGYESRASTTGSRINRPERVKGRETTVEGQRSGTRDKGPGRGDDGPQQRDEIQISEIIQMAEGNEDPPCGYTKGRVTLS